MEGPRTILAGHTARTKAQKSTAHKQSTGYRKVPVSLIRYCLPQHR